MSRGVAPPTLPRPAVWSPAPFCFTVVCSLKVNQKFWHINTWDTNWVVVDDHRGRRERLRWQSLRCTKPIFKSSLLWRFWFYSCFDLNCDFMVFFFLNWMRRHCCELRLPLEVKQTIPMHNLGSAYSTNGQQVWLMVRDVRQNRIPQGFSLLFYLWVVQ